MRKLYFWGNLFATSFHFNLLANFLLNYTYYSGFSYDDIWFNLRSTDAINLTEQTNLFLPYKTYTLKLNTTAAGQQFIDKQTYNNYFNPLWYVGLQAIILCFTFGVSIYKFNKADFN
ncbi:hypothetical protein [Spiroplasma clarkii]|uniref:hypothetical protein n=1 Tax=Spiroplasma clarkii TaxID=2139 RepID=UPI0011BA82FD|nr:hypothetical protein [Spiroplasma clarkii]